MKKRFLGALALLVLVCIVGFAFLSIMAKNGQRSLSFAQIDMSNVADGIYEGDADANIVHARVCVTVRERRMTSIDILEHRNGLGEKAEAIADAMVAGNTYDVDAISGATLSSEVIKSAVSNALQGEKTP